MTGRPLYRPEVTWITDRGAAIPPLDLPAVQRHREVAESTAQHATEWIDTVPAGLLSGDHLTVAQGAYAQAVTDVLSWLMGEEPSAELAALLDLDGGPR